MRANIVDSNSLDKVVVEKFEWRIGIKLPEDYKNFLLTNNGGYPDPDCFTTKDQKDGSSIDRFLGIDVGENSNLEKYWNCYKNRIPDGFFPIAHDPGGNLVVIKIGKYGNDEGVYFWDHENEADGYKPNMSNLSKVADSFNSFLECLHELPD